MQKHANVLEKRYKNMNGMKRRQRKRMKYAMYDSSNVPMKYRKGEMRGIERKTQKKM